MGLIPFLPPQPDDVTRYYNSSSTLKANEARPWTSQVSIMNPHAVMVPMNNGAATITVGTKLEGGKIPAKQGNNAGAIDRYYFFASDIAYMRKNPKSPGE